MKFLVWIILWFLVNASSVWSLEKEDIFQQTEIVETSDITPLDKTTPDILAKQRKRVQEKEERVPVIKKTELGRVLESVYEKHQAYLSINRHERVTKDSSDENQDSLKLELARDIKPTIRVIDKPLVLGGDGFGAAGLEVNDYKLHFTFNSHLKVPTHYELKKEDVSYFDPSLERAQSRKFLIFHRSSSNFGRQGNLFEEPNLDQPMKQKMVYVRPETVPSSWIFFDAHVKEFQNKETSLRLLPAKSPLDLIYDNPAILQYNYQVMNSGGS